MGRSKSGRVTAFDQITSEQDGRHTECLICVMRRYSSIDWYASDDAGTLIDRMEAVRGPESWSQKQIADAKSVQDSLLGTMAPYSQCQQGTAQLADEQVSAQA